MKKIFTLAGFVGMLLGYQATAQTGSVVLKDGTGATINSYNSITTANAAVPATVTQAYIIELQSTYTGANETYPITFGARAGASTTNTLTLRPAAGVSAVSVSGSNNGPIILLNDADYMIIDGRAGGTGTTRTLTVNNTLVGSSTVAVIRLIDGATFNTIRYCNVQGIYTGTNATSGIHLSSSTNATGNSDNLVENCRINGSRNLIYITNTTANRNTRNIVRNCEFVDIAFAGIWASGTGKLTVDNCKFYSLVASVNTSVGVHGILFDSQADTVIFTNNQMYDLNNGTNTTYCKAFVIRSVTGVPYFFVANNMISIMGANATSSKVTGIEHTAGAIIGKFFHNTIRLGGTGTTGSSAPISKLSNVATTELDIFNNIFINERTGGTGPHYAVDVTSTAGTININYNTYAATGTFANLGGTAVPTFALYQAALLAPNEANSNTAPVQFVSNTDLHLTGTSVGNVLLTGTTAITPPVTTDIDGQTRTTPYRGADEATPVVTCTGTPTATTVTGPAATVCSGVNFTLNATGQSTGNGITYRWQSRPAATGAYTFITGATAIPYTTSATQSTQYRLVTTCTASSLSDTSNAVTVTITPRPSVTSISETHTALAYNFTANGVQNAVTYTWNFGDGSALSAATAPSHTYAAIGTYTVVLVVSNACGTDTARLTVNATIPGCTGTPAVAAVTASVTAACISIPFTLTATGQPTGNGIYYKWQSTTNGGSNWTTLGVTSVPTFTTSINTARDFRMVDSCAFSGLTATSNVLRMPMAPQPVINAVTYTNTGLTYTFTAAGAQNVTRYEWTFGDNLGTSTLASPTYTYAAHGIYAVKAIVFNTCGSAEQTVVVNTRNTSAGTVTAAEKQVTLYPNPANDWVQLAASDNLKINQVMVIDAVGKTLQLVDAINQKDYRLETGRLPSGHYQLRIVTSAGMIHKKLHILR